MPRARRRSRAGDWEAAGPRGEDPVLQCALETLSCVVEAVARSAEVCEAQESDESALRGEYGALRWRWPLERAMEAASAWSLAASCRAAPRLGEGEVSVEREIAELERLAASAGEGSARRSRLEALQVRKRQLLASSSRAVEAPRELEVLQRTAEDPLEARWDARGETVPLRTNVIGEPFASRRNPLSYTRGKTPAQIFARMKRAVKDEISARERRRIAALNERARAKKQELEALGYISPEAALEARFDHLMRRVS